MSGCRHCGAVKVRRRGLCGRCYRTPKIARKYPSVSKFAVWGVGHRGNVLPVPMPLEVQEVPEKRLEVLCGRAERGESLWHPLDGVPGALLNSPDLADPPGDLISKGRVS